MQLTGLGSTLPKNSSKASFMGAKSSMVVRKILILTMLFRLLPAASSTADIFFIAVRCFRLSVFLLSVVEKEKKEAI